MSNGGGPNAYLEQILQQATLARQDAKAAREERAKEQERLRGRKPIRFRASGIAVSSAITLGGDSSIPTGPSGGTSTTPQPFGPQEGYVWSVRLIVVGGMTSGATPDVLNLRLNNTSGPILWQFNGNNFGYTFGRGEMVFFDGESLFFNNVGTFASTSTITVYGLAENLPSERIGEFY